MYRIGEFSYLCETTVKTLRHYNKINLLNPKKIDESTGYRYYTDNQIETFNKINALQTAGFKLTEIKSMLEHLKEEKIEKTNNQPQKWIGTWCLQGEITKLPKMVKYKRKHYIPDTKYKILELHEDGTTNFKNITWKDKYLIVQEENQEYYYYLLTTKKKLLNTYMEVLINQKASNSRPYNYYYKKGK